jgi:hypothetical protein
LRISRRERAAYESAKKRHDLAREAVGLHARVGPSASVTTFRIRVSMIITHSVEMGMHDGVLHTTKHERWRSSEMGMSDDVSHIVEHDALAFEQDGHERQRYAHH